MGEFSFIFHISFLHSVLTIDSKFSIELQVLFSIMIGSFFLSQATNNFGLLDIAAAVVDSSIDIIKQVRAIQAVR